MNIENKEACKYILEHYGAESQLRMLAEECSELAIEALKSIRAGKATGNLSWEIADVLIMIEQIRLEYAITDDLLKLICDTKINRQLERIKAEEKSHDRGSI